MNMHGVVKELTESHRSEEQPMALQKEGEQAAGLTRPKPKTMNIMLRNLDFEPLEDFEQGNACLDTREC